MFLKVSGGNCPVAHPLVAGLLDVLSNHCKSQDKDFSETEYTKMGIKASLDTFINILIVETVAMY